ncbi:hypothetical protein LCGC14_1077580 [marine sediment metagenome]|uniref:Uncharacterized protein n=1 Tax=marine sediment metagenome TaxID=412755 RepID=A0A0F9N3R6_9ZZZZ
MFKFDEAAINEQFGRMLDIMPSCMILRSAIFPVMGQLALLRLPSLKLLPLLGYEEIEFGLEVRFNRELLQRASVDFIELTIQQFLGAMMRGIVDKSYSIGRPLTVGPLMFEYIELADGTEIIVTVLIEWGFLR